MGDQGNASLSIRPRTNRILSRIDHNPPHLSVDRARLFTASYRTTEHLPLVLRWAMALAHVVRNIDVHILPDELIVGRGGPEGHYGILYPELEGAYFAIADSLLEEKTNILHYFTIGDVTVIKNELLPFWAGKTFRESLADSLPNNLKNLLYKDGNIYKPSFIIHETATVRHSLQWVLDYRKVIERGYESIHDEAQHMLDTIDINNSEHNWDKAPFYRAIIIMCEAMRDFALRHAALARQLAASSSDADRAAELEEIARVCEHVPWKPARTFREALQAQWFTQLVSRFEQIHGGIIGNGRMDQYLYPLYKQDIGNGSLDRDGVLELLDCLWLNIAQFLRLQPTAAGILIYEGNAHWEHTTIGGVLTNGLDATNELSWLLLRSCREFPLDYPDLCVRIHPETPQDFLLEVCETIKHGGCSPKMLNDFEIIPLLVEKGAQAGEARDYCGSGCSEVRLINRNTYFTGTTWFNLAAVLEMALYNGHCSTYGNTVISIQSGDARSFKDYSQLEDAFYKQLSNIITQIITQQYITDTLRPHHLAAPLLSCLHDLCMAEGKDINQGRFKNGLSYGGQIGPIGFATVVDSLSAIKHVVFDRQIMSLEHVIQALRNNFEGFEVERQYCCNAPKYGNQIAEVDEIGRRLEAFMVEQCQRHTNFYGGQPEIFYVPVTSHIAMGRITGATPNGRRAGEALSAGIAPSPGACRAGLTAALHSLAATKQEKATARAARMFDLTLAPCYLAGTEGREKLASIIRAWCLQKHWHLQIHLLDAAALRQASNDQEKIRNHAVELAGFCFLPHDVTPEIQASLLKTTLSYL